MKMITLENIFIYLQLLHPHASSSGGAGINVFSGSELNMFWEYTMASEAKYNEYFGFTDSEVDQLYEKYTRNTREIHISREDLKEWYDG